MRLSIRHHTTYRYDKPADYAAQILRLTPRRYGGLTILSWKLTTGGGGRLSSFEDGFGNVSHVHTVAHLHDKVEVMVEGIVETSDTGGTVSGGYEPLPLGVFLRSTSLTLPSKAIGQLASDAAASASVRERLVRLMELVRERIDYVPGATSVLTTAADALAGGSGVCQDHAHVFISAARQLGIPARYVGGYLCMDGIDAITRHDEKPAAAISGEQAGHAWAEAFDSECGWLAFDPANATIPESHYVRTSVGLDYFSASPVRGVRSGRGGTDAAESLTVDVQVARLAGQ